MDDDKEDLVVMGWVLLGATCVGVASGVLGGASVGFLAFGVTCLLWTGFAFLSD